MRSKPFRRIHNIYVGLINNYYTICQVIIIPCLLLITGSAIAQKPQAYEMSVNGVKVIVHPAGNKIVVVQTFISGGTRNYSPAKAGLEALCLSAMAECGTLNDDKTSFKNKLSNVNAQLTNVPTADFSSIRMNCIDMDFDTVFRLYADAIHSPVFNKDDFEIVKLNLVNLEILYETDPEEMIQNQAITNTFKGRHYGVRPRGDSASLSAITLNDVKQHWKKIFTRSRMLIVVIADLPKDTIRSKISAMLAKVPAGSQTSSGSPVLSGASQVIIPANSINIVQREFETNYLFGITAAPVPGAQDFNAYAIAVRIFRDRQYMEIRDKHGLSYDTRVRLYGNIAPFTGIVGSTDDPDKFVVLTRRLIDSISKNGFDAQELAAKKSVYVTQEYMNMELNESMADMLGASELTHGNWRRALTIKNDIRKVGLAEVNAAFKKYVTNIAWTYAGDPAKVNQELFRQGTTPASEKRAF